MTACSGGSRRDDTMAAKIRGNESPGTRRVVPPDTPAIFQPAQDREAASVADEKVEQLAYLATDLLSALQPWQMQSPEVRSAAVRLTVALAALPLPERAA